MKRYIKKLFVCKECLSDEIVDVNCICVTNNSYPSIELEFNFCECCDRTLDLVENEFNEQQLTKR